MHEPIQYPIIFPPPFPSLQDTQLNHSQTSSHAMMASPMPPPTDKSKTATAAAAIAAMRPADQEGLKCPRCDSPNTKFCYYNNYSLTQPRHFCKTCRRYWTKGGALRNVPVGGGCRKSKKSKCSHHTNISSSSALSTSSSSSLVPQFDAINNFHIGHMLPYYPIPGAAVYDDRVSVGSSAHHGSIASSIESLSSINQDLHWKLQQQRLQAMLFGGEGQKHILPTPHVDSYQVADTSKKGVENDTTTAWFLENSFNVPYANINNTATSNNNSGGNNNNENNASDWNGIPTWSDMHHFTALP